MILTVPMNGAVLTTTPEPRICSTVSVSWRRAYVMTVSVTVSVSVTTSTVSILIVATAMTPTNVVTAPVTIATPEFTAVSGGTTDSH
jgi:hypothetical protein